MDGDMIDSVLDQQSDEGCSCSLEEIQARVCLCKDKLNVFIHGGLPRDAEAILSVARELELCGRLLEVHRRINRGAT